MIQKILRVIQDWKFFIFSLTMVWLKDIFLSFEWSEYFFTVLSPIFFPSFMDHFPGGSCGSSSRVPQSEPSLNSAPDPTDQLRLLPLTLTFTILYWMTTLVAPN